MAVLRFTRAGVVPTPTTVQLRVTERMPGRLPAGAPVPERGLTDEELAQNLDYFLQGLRGPRTTACTSVVLSGADLPRRTGLASILAGARRKGLERVTAHLGPGERRAWVRTPLSDQTDDVVLVVRNEADVVDLGVLVGGGVRISAVVPLTAEALSDLVRRARDIGAARPARVVFTWPFIDPPPPPASAVAAALPQAVRAIQEIAPDVGIAIKGLPLCALGALSQYGARTRNRWYVDAAHQKGSALLFFPEVLRMSKADVCRSCALEPRCDGAPERWRVAGLVGAFLPFNRTDRDGTLA